MTDILSFSYLRILFLVLGVLFIHFKVQLGRRDGQRSRGYQAGRNQFGTAAQVDWSYSDTTVSSIHSVDKNSAMIERGRTC